MAYIVKTSDFYEALSMEYDGIVIDKATHLTNYNTLIETNFGNFVCEGFDDFSGNGYTKVYKLKTKAE